MSDPSRPGPAATLAVDQRQKRINTSAVPAPFVDDLDEEFDPKAATGGVFADGKVPGISAFPWQERPLQGWPAGYSPFAVPVQYDTPLADDSDTGEPDWEAIEVAVRERGYEQGYTQGHQAGAAEGRQLGRVDGLAEGHADGFAQGVAEARGAFEGMGAAVDDLRAVGAELEARYVRATVELATRIADRVLGNRLAQTPELLVQQVGSAIARFRGVERCVIQVHPDDAALLAGATELVRGPQGVVDVVVEGDAEIRRGGWRVQTAFGGVDGTLDERLKSVIEALRQVEARWDEPSAAAVVSGARVAMEQVAPDEQGDSDVEVD